MERRLLGLCEHPAKVFGEIAEPCGNLRVVHSCGANDADHALHAVADVKLRNDDAGIFQLLRHVLGTHQNLRRAGRERRGEIRNDVFIEARQNLLRFFYIVVLWLAKKLRLPGHVNLAVGLF